MRVFSAKKEGASQVEKFERPVRSGGVFYDAEYYGHTHNQLQFHDVGWMHSAGYRGQGLVIAVIDAGYYKVNELEQFQSYFDKNQILGTYDFVEPGNDVYREHQHGTYVLATIGSELEGQLIGSAPEANFWLLRSEDAGAESLAEEYNWAAAAEFADSVGADILNTSLGYTTFDDSDEDHVYADLDGNTTPITIAADIAASKGMLVVNSAGNSGESDWLYIGAPADGDSVLAVGGIDSLGAYASFSSIGPSADGRIKPNVAAKGERTTSISFNAVTKEVNGTSFAAPIVSGLAACLWQAYPEKSSMEIFRALEESAHQYDQPDEYLGYGIPNLRRAYSILMASSLDGESVFTALIYPTLVQDCFHVEVLTQEDGIYDMALFDVQGRVIWKETLLMEKESVLKQAYSIREKSLSPGLYTLRFSQGERVLRTEKIIVSGREQ